MDRKTYWRQQMTRTIVLLCIWAFVGLGLSILFVESLNELTFIGMPLGFWVAQQGAIFVFVILVFMYAFLSQRADRASNLEEVKE